MNKLQFFLTSIFLLIAAICPIAAAYAAPQYVVPLWILGFLMALLAMWTAIRRYKQNLVK